MEGLLRRDGCGEQCQQHADMSERGYLLLTDCKITVSQNISTKRGVLCGKWNDVSLIYSSEEVATILSACGKEEFCSVCDLVFHTGVECSLSSSNNVDISPHLCLLVQNASRFDGTIVNMGHHNNNNHHNKHNNNCNNHSNDPQLSTTTRQLKRSDASLMMGLALACQDQGHISIQSVRVLLREEPQNRRIGERMHHTDSSCNGRGQDSSLLITIAFPHLLKHGSIMPVKSRKPLPPSTQLLLSLVRSDWEFLDREMARGGNSFAEGLELDAGRPHNVCRPHNVTNGTEHASFFPHKLSLEELYMRVPKSSNTPFHHHIQIQMNRQERGLMDLPQEVLASRLAPFLRAKCLDALRCTCKYLHEVLRSVVPGMRLRLYQHQIKSLNRMRMLETRQIAESNVCKSTYCKGFMFPDGDGHRVITGGKSVLICSRNGQSSGGIRLDQFVGRHLPLNEVKVLDRKAPRGGLLCDDPGLGKTITVLSLILHTMSLSTQRNVDTSEEGRESDASEEAVFRAYWKEEITPAFRSPELLKLMGDLKRKSGDNILFFERPVDPELDGCPDYFELIQHPICLKTIKRKIDAGDYGDSFDAFESDVKLCFQNAIEYHPSENFLHIAAVRFKCIFASLVSAFKLKIIGSARKSFSNTGVKPNCSVAALLAEESSDRVMKALVPSSSTLLVIPSVLMEHWQEQIEMHVDLSYCTGTDRIPLIYEYGSREEDGDLDEIFSKCKLKKTHSPVVFLDKAGTRKLPSPEFLSMFALVITTTKRFTNEWKNGSFQDELYQRNNLYCDSFHDKPWACPLLKVYWLRMIVDEGHSMGRGHGSCAIRFASWISAQRRWAVTGTPTRQTVSQNGLHNLLGLMHFLRNEFFTPRLDGNQFWKSQIARSWSDGCLASFFRLRSLLSLLMIRHTKLDIEELPAPRFQTTVIPMSFVEVNTYNTLICAVQSNILITSMEAKTSGSQDSLLHRSQATHARKALSNIQLACSGGTRVIPTLSQKFWHEFIDCCRNLYMPEYKIEALKKYLHRAETEELSRCMCCGILLSTLLVLPCGDLVCTECMDSKTTICVVCEEPFDADEFQRLQPGLDYQWKWNLEEEQAVKKARAMEVPDPSLSVQAYDGTFAQDNVVIRPVRPGNRRRPKFGDGHLCEYDKHSATGKCIHCSAEHQFCKLVNTMSQCKVCYRLAEACPREEAKAAYLVDKLLKLYEEQKRSNSRGCCRLSDSVIEEEMDNANSLNTRPLKVIIFSQFRKSLNLAGDRLLRRFGTACVAEYWGSFRSEELHKFTHEDDCFCMLLGKDGSEGLDLSFVTHIFFLEAVWDKSLENQVVARAWRMGAKGRVYVETLVAQSSVEELMWKLERMLAGHISEKESSDEDIQLLSATECPSGSNYVRTKVHFLLKNLELIKHPSIIPLIKAKTEKRQLSSGGVIQSPPSSLPSSPSSSPSTSSRLSPLLPALLPSPSPSPSPSSSPSPSPSPCRKKRKIQRVVRFNLPNT